MIEIEQILGPDAVARHVEFPRTYDAVRSLVLDTVFEFPNGRPESVVWRKYAPTEADVHDLGREWGKRRQERRPETEYVGFIASTAEMIRSIRTAPGHGFEVVHAPEEGQHHAHVQYQASAQGPFPKSHRTELKYALRKAFGKLVPVPPSA